MIFPDAWLSGLTDGKAAIPKEETTGWERTSATYPPCWGAMALMGTSGGLLGWECGQVPQQAGRRQNFCRWRALRVLSTMLRFMAKMGRGAEAELTCPAGPQGSFHPARAQGPARVGNS